MPASGMFTEPTTWPRSSRDGTPKPTAPMSSSSRSRTAVSSAAIRSSCELVGVGVLAVALDLAARIDDPGEDLRPADVDADDPLGAHGRRLP